MKIPTLTCYIRLLLPAFIAIIAIFAFSVPFTFAQDGRDDSNVAPTDTAKEAEDRNDTDALAPKQKLEDFREQERKRMQEIREREKTNLENRRESDNEQQETFREMQNKKMETIRERFDNDDDFDAKRTEIRNEIEKRREEMKEHLEERKADLEQKQEENIKRYEERQVRLEESAKHRVSAYIERIIRRFNAAVERLDKISERITSRIEKFEEQGKDMTTARELLRKADEKLLLTHEALDQFTNETSALLETEDPKTAFESMKELLTIAKSSMKEAHSALIEVIRAIKVAGGLNDDSNANKDVEDTDAVEE